MSVELREFFYVQAGQRVVLPDPDPGMAADDVRKLYASQHPALLNAKVIYPDSGRDYEFVLESGKAASGAAATSGGKQSIEFKPSVGRKG